MEMKEKISRDELLILIMAVLTAGVLIVAVHSGIEYLNGYREQKENAVALEKEEQSKLEMQKKQEDLEKQLKENLRDKELADLRQQLLDLQNKSSETESAVNTATGETEDSVADIVKHWSPRITHIKCSWHTKSGELYGTASGSATLVNFTYLGIRAITSKHIFLSSTDKSLPKSCVLSLTDKSSYSVLIDSASVSMGKDQDWAYIALPKDGVLSNITRQDVKLCSNVEIGDRLAILGYPKIGSATGLTVTEGIVSGLDETYYITSAKIDKGNSGGAAILIKDDCYLGIPTASVVGSIESLGRILKAKFFIE